MQHGVPSGYRFYSKNIQTSMDIIAEICSVPIIRKGSRRINTGKTVKITAQMGKVAIPVTMETISVTTNTMYPRKQILVTGALFSISSIRFFSRSSLSSLRKTYSSRAVFTWCAVPIMIKKKREPSCYSASVSRWGIYIKYGHSRDLSHVLRFRAPVKF